MRQPTHYGAIWYFKNFKKLMNKKCYPLRPHGSSASAVASTLTLTYRLKPRSSSLSEHGSWAALALIPHQLLLATTIPAGEGVYSLRRIFAFKTFGIHIWQVGKLKINIKLQLMWIDCKDSPYLPTNRRKQHTTALSLWVLNFWTTLVISISTKSHKIHLIALERGLILK